MKPQLFSVIGASLAVLGMAFGTGCEGDELTSSVPVYRSAAPVPETAAATPTAAETPPSAVVESTPVVETAAEESAPAIQPTSPLSSEAAPTVVAPMTAPAVAATGATNEPGTNLAAQVVQPAVIPPKLEVTPALEELIKMVQAGVKEDVLLSYLENSTNIFNVGADEIIYLNDLGVPSPVITRLIEQDASPGSVARKQAANAVKPLPRELVLKQPATNVYPSKAAPPPPANTPPEEAPVYASEPPQYAVTPGAEVPADTTYFYGALAPYGNWVQVPDYGLCWQPTVALANPSWRPYSDNGRWYWTDRGWYWYSYYSWGWAPFHYGRWCQPTGLGWIWVPDDYWGPAWVTWRYTPYYCGWAPLPPRCYYVDGFGLYYGSASVGLGFSFGFGADYYSFIHWNYFCDPHPHHYYVRHDRALAIFRDSKCINDYGRGDRVFNRGVGLDRAARLSRSQIREVSIREAPMTSRSGARREQLVHDGSRSLLVHDTLPPSVKAGGQIPGRKTFSRGSTAASINANATSRATRAAPPAASRSMERQGTSSALTASPSRREPGTAERSTPRAQPRTAPRAANATVAESPSAADRTTRAAPLTSPRSTGTAPPSARFRTEDRSSPTRQSTRSVEVSRPASRDSAPPPTFRNNRVPGPRSEAPASPTATPQSPSRRQLMESTLAHPAPTTSFSALDRSQPVQRSVPSAARTSRSLNPPPPQYRSDMYRSYADAPSSSRSPVPSVRRESPTINRSVPSAPRVNTRQPFSFNSYTAPKSSTPSYRASPSPAPSSRSVQPSVRSSSPPRSIMRSAPAVRSAPSVRSAPAVRSAPSRPSFQRSAPTRSAPVTRSSPPARSSRSSSPAPSQRSSRSGRER